MCASKVRDVADHAVQWALKQGASIPDTDLVYQMSLIGASGKHPQNSERDLHRLAKDCAGSFTPKVSTVQVRMYNHKTGEIELADTSVIFPDDFICAVWELGEHIFRRCFCGTEDIGQYWKHHMEHCSWFKSHPAYHYPSKDRLLPFSLYGDDVTCYKGTESGSVSVLAFTSDLVYGNEPLQRYFLMNVMSEHFAVEETFTDLLGLLIPHIRQLTNPEVARPWSRAGYQWMFSAVQGDLKWISDHFNMFNFRRNDFCSKCDVRKEHPDVSMTVADFRPNAAHRGTQYGHEEFMARHAPPQRYLFCIFTFLSLLCFVLLVN